jgi:hypothetical protein
MRTSCCVLSGMDGAVMSFVGCMAYADLLPLSASYRPLPTLLLDAVKANDEADQGGELS